MEMHLHIIRRKTAVERGLKHYFNGRPCLRNHISLRYTATRECIACHSERLKEWRAGNKDHINAYNAAYQEENREYYRSYSRFSLSCKKARQRRVAMKKAGTLQVADPRWDLINKKRMQHLQQLARQYEEWLGIKFEVDHIVPIIDDKVCGLHWHGNLQLIPMRLNRLKRGVITHETAA